MRVPLLRFPFSEPVTVGRLPAVFFDGSTAHVGSRLRSPRPGEPRWPRRPLRAGRAQREPRRAQGKPRGSPGEPRGSPGAQAGPGERQAERTQASARRTQAGATSSPPSSPHGGSRPPGYRFSARFRSRYRSRTGVYLGRRFIGRGAKVGSAQVRGWDDEAELKHRGCLPRRASALSSSGGASSGEELPKALFSTRELQVWVAPLPRYRERCGKASRSSTKSGSIARETASLGNQQTRDMGRVNVGGLKYTCFDITCVFALSCVLRARFFCKKW